MPGETAGRALRRCRCGASGEAATDAAYSEAGAAPETIEACSSQFDSSASTYERVTSFICDWSISSSICDCAISSFICDVGEPGPSSTSTCDPSCAHVAREPGDPASTCDPSSCTQDTCEFGEPGERAENVGESGAPKSMQRCFLAFLPLQCLQAKATPAKTAAGIKMAPTTYTNNMPLLVESSSLSSWTLTTFAAMAAVSNISAAALSVTTTTFPSEWSSSFFVVFSICGLKVVLLAIVLTAATCVPTFASLRGSSGHVAGPLQDPGTGSMVGTLPERPCNQQPPLLM
mmetsp:Transcript_28090/g.80624  ORF Transcript_28090/g.80624 Transcript_28090/m.80624 type:complete len:289 (-) Transcript_28090:26-892(-)